MAGRGNLGRSLARAFRAAGHSVRLVPSRSGFRLPREGIVFLAVPDGQVAETAERIAQMEPDLRLSFVHLSGALGLDSLSSLRGHALGSFHPLQSFPFPREPAAFHGITVGVDATSGMLMRRLRTLARDLGAKPHYVSERDRAAYHAAAVYASNFVDVLIAEGVRQLEKIGWTEEASLEALLPLVDGALATIRNKGPVRALTGPIRRGDADTVKRHLAVVDSPDLYRMLGLVALGIAREAGLDPAAAERTRRALTRNVAATRRRRGR